MKELLKNKNEGKTFCCEFEMDRQNIGEKFEENDETETNKWFSNRMEKC